MKPIEVRDQVRLGPARVLGLTIAGMSHRMFRSMVTVAILSLAVAFLAHMITYGLIEHSTLTGVYRELRDSRLLGEWVTRLSLADGEGAVESALAGGAQERLREYKTWSGVSDQEFKWAQETARRLQQVYGYFEGLSGTAQGTLTAGLEPRELLDRLRRAGQLDEFERHLEELKLEPPLGTIESFRKLVTEEVAREQAVVAKVQEGQRRAIAQVHAAYPGRSTTQLLAERPKGLGDTLAQAGFALGEEAAAKLSRLAHERERFDRVVAAMNLAQSKAAIRQRLNTERAVMNTTAVLGMMSSAGDAKWLSEVLTKNSGEKISTEELLALLQTQERLNRLQAAAGDKPPVTGSGWLGLAGGAGWLIGLSFLVCTVGVANAMFMSVTERFAEIATMKCLGALDGFLMTMFLFESGMQGLVGALAGVVIGVGLAILRGLGIYGTLISVPWWDMLAGCGVCLVAGMVLAVLGGVGPAWAAARLAPMEAMRIE